MALSAENQDFQRNISLNVAHGKEVLADIHQILADYKGDMMNNLLKMFYDFLTTNSIQLARPKSVNNDHAVFSLENLKPVQGKRFLISYLK